MSLFVELKRRNVFRIGIAYMVLSWLVLQVADVVVPILELPEWVARLVLFLLIIGFPFALFFAWAYEMTPEGLRREEDVDRSQSITTQTGRKLDRAIIGILVVAVALLLFDRFAGRSIETPPAQSEEQSASIEAPEQAPLPRGGAKLAEQSDEKSVAVLPFVNMSDDEQNEYFSDGISEELLNLLVRIEGLRVPSRTSSFTFKGSEMKLSDIGRELGVDHVLEGSVRKAGKRIRVTAQLIDVHSDSHLWSETYTRELDDIFAVQDEIAHAIVGALKVTLSGAEERMLDLRPTDNVEAYNLYLRGRHHWNLRIPGRMAEAIPPLLEAVELDPQFDRAWAALADAYLLLPEYGEGPPSEHIPKALKAARRALSINPDSAQALTSSAYIKAMHQFQWDEAEEEFLRAIELNPQYRTAHQWYAEVLAAQRRIDESLAQLEIASAVDPLAPIVPHIKGWVTLWANRLDEAEAHYLDALRLDPGFPYAMGNLATVYILQGRYEEARALYNQLGELIDIDQRLNLLFVDAMENPVLRAEVVEVYSAVPIPTQPFDVPVAFMLFERPDLALDVLLRNFEADSAYVPHINRIFIFDPLREDPRFQQMLAKMNLWP